LTTIDLFSNYIDGLPFSAWFKLVTKKLGIWLKKIICDVKEIITRLNDTVSNISQLFA